MKATDSVWRREAAPIIAQVIAENGDKPLRDIRRALRKAYPFGQRKYHPYKIWLDEIRNQLYGPQHRMLSLAVDPQKLRTAFLGPRKSRVDLTLDNPTGRAYNTLTVEVLPDSKQVHT